MRWCCDARRSDVATFCEDVPLYALAQNITYMYLHVHRASALYFFRARSPIYLGLQRMRWTNY
jgi:hypothetical protein